jgi:hypothetical protein
LNSVESRPLTLALDHRIGAEGDPAQVAAALAAVWHAVDATLSPLLGPLGVAAMYRRSLALSAQVHPWLPHPDAADPGPDIAALAAALEGQDGARALAAGHAFLLAFQDLLASLVGASLGARLLAPVLDPLTSGPPAQDTLP